MSKKLTLLDCQKAAKANNGFCDSTEYKDAISKMSWRCKEGHKWQANLHSIRNMHSWCDKCAHTKLGLSKRTNIEICQNYHYIYPNTFYKTIEAFNAQLKRDDLKEQYCAERDIRLLIIPYTEYKNLESYINQLIIEGE
jgi:hypothetical protein